MDLDPASLEETRQARDWALNYVRQLPSDVLRDLALVVSHGSMNDIGLLRMVTNDLATTITERRARREREAFGRAWEASGD